MKFGESGLGLSFFEGEHTRGERKDDVRTGREKDKISVLYGECGEVL